MQIFFKVGGGGNLGLQAKRGGGSFGPMLKRLHRGPKGGGATTPVNYPLILNL